MRSSFIALFVFTLIALPGIAFSSHQSGIVPCHGTDCRACDLVALGQRIIEWLITVMTFVIALVFVAGGFQMVTSGGDTGAVSSAREKMTNAAIGFMIMLLAWLIVDTALKMLLKPEERNGMGPWSAVECIEPMQYAAGTPTTPSGTSGTVTTGGGGTVAEGALNHDSALTRLNNAGVIVTSTSGAGGVRADCQSGSGCTSLQGIREQTLMQAVNIKNGCPSCTVAIVGATEGGHATGPQSHSSGYKIDVEDNAALDSYLTSTLRADGQRAGQFGGPRYRDNCGNEYVRESTHWDISVTNGSCGL